MTQLPDQILKAWENIEGPVVLSTVDGNGIPNSIYATCVNLCGEDCIVVADNYFDKTRQNILKGGKHGSLLFICKDGKAYQVKGTLEYHTEGAIFNHMKTWNPVKHPGHAAAVLRCHECYCGSDRIK